MKKLPTIAIDIPKGECTTPCIEGGMEICDQEYSGLVRAAVLAYRTVCKVHEDSVQAWRYYVPGFSDIDFVLIGPASDITGGRVKNALLDSPDMGSLIYETVEALEEEYPGLITIDWMTGEPAWKEGTGDEIKAAYDVAYPRKRPVIEPLEL